MSVNISRVSFSRDRHMSNLGMVTLHRSCGSASLDAVGKLESNSRYAPPYEIASSLKTNHLEHCPGRCKENAILPCSSYYRPERITYAYVLLHILLGWQSVCQGQSLPVYVHQVHSVERELRCHSKPRHVCGKRWVGGK
jgi:hypothetical protein